MTFVPKKAFVLAAGKGERMRPLTNTRPKPLIEVAGKTMLDHCLDKLVAVGVEEIVVNTWYLGQMIVDHLKDYKPAKIIFSNETELLDTGGGVKLALHHFGDEPFFALNADILWEDGPSKPALMRLAEKWDGDKMDVLLLLQSTKNLPDYAGVGDYYLAPGSDKPVFAKGEGKDITANYIFTGPRIAHPRIFEGAPEGAFSFLQLFHKAEKAGRLYAVAHDGAWHHVGTPEALEKTNEILMSKAG
jgi:MurNAc alpha-1-phosphate uridylyltransferase